MKLYLHTIEGYPAGFDEETGQICYAEKGKCSWYAKPVKDLKTIRKQQSKTFKFRKQFKEEYDKYQTKYDYVIIDVD